MFPLSASLSIRKEKLHCTRYGDDGGYGRAVILVLDNFMQKKIIIKLGSAIVNEQAVSSAPLLYELLPYISP
jgi:hypothetical protein